MFKPYLVWSFLLLMFTAGLAMAETADIGNSVTQPSEHFGKIVISLVLVLLIIFFSAWLLRRYSRFPGVADGNLKVIGALSVGQREKILLLQVGSEQVLVGVTSSQITTLHQLEERVELKDNEPVASQFSQRLQDALKSKDKQPASRADN